MSTSDQDGQRQLTRKQLREIRLTGSTPVITEEQAAAAAQPAPVLARAADPVEVSPVPEAELQESDAPLTRRQMRALEHVRAAADDPVSDESVADEDDTSDDDAEEFEVVDEAPVGEVVVIEPVEEEPLKEEPVEDESLVSGIPVFAPTPAVPGLPRFAVTDSSDSDQAQSSLDASDGPQPEAAANDASAEEADAVEVITAERPMVGAAFGLGVTREASQGALFDDLLDGGSSSGSQHAASTALIFTPSAGAGSLSGPIASTGELLITGTYALADGIGSHGHAHGTADGRDVDAVLLDGELAPSSSPTPIAASSAVSTSKSAGEVIRPPMPDKSNKLMLALAIVAGGLALALAATLIIAATTGVFG